MKKHNEINKPMYIIYLFIKNTILIWSLFHCNYAFAIICSCAFLTKPVFKVNKVGQNSHDFLATLSGGSSLSFKDNGWDDWSTMRLWDDDS
jgi:hypothetical protein